MFSGIISALGNVKNIVYNGIYSVDIEILTINLEDFEKPENLIKIGCSIACSGVCLTLTNKRKNILNILTNFEFPRRFQPFRQVN